ncbi:MAG: di-trans,poly-cis-decaprenylcistransferase, partial [Clostridia bacterium]|nr:di-trans,poly-cis-decaprenylcistransferase [Clostridia bacterium]
MNKLTHVAIIMDGNGRWAKSKGLVRMQGHKQGLVTAEKIIEHSIKRGIKYISLYVFSTENWKRPQKEISTLFSLADKYLDKFQEFCKNQVRVVVSVDKTGLPQKMVDKIELIQNKTAKFDAICVNLCINYGGQADIVQAVNKLVESGTKVTCQSLQQSLYNGFIPAPDIIVRTGGQKRLSNFLLYQSA